MYICPICNIQFETDDILVKHYGKCWRERNPNHKSKSAPRSADVNTREIDDELLNFFKLGAELYYGRNRS